MKLHNITECTYAFVEVEENGSTTFYRREIHDDGHYDVENPMWECLCGESWESLYDYYEELEEFYNEWQLGRGN